MKLSLHEFFEQFQGEKLEDSQKLQIYNKFLDKSRKALYYKRFRYYAKVTSFSFALLLVVILGYVIFQPNMGDRAGYQVAQVSDAYITLESNVGTVQADSIGEIVYANGDIKIFKNDEQVEQVEELRDNDRVLLQSDAVIEFTVRDGVKARIEGPAEFSVENLGLSQGMPEYAINLIDGDYLEVESIPADEEETETQEDRPEDNLVIKTPDFELEKVNGADDLHIVIATKNDKTTVENAGGEVVIKKLAQETEEKKFVSVKSNQIVAVNGDISLLSDEEAAEVVDQIKEQPLTIRYDLGEEETENSATAADVLQSDSEQSGRSVLDGERADSLAHLLNSTQLNHQLGQAARYYYAGNQDSFSIAFDNLVSRITRAYELLDLQVESSVARLDSREKNLQQGIILVDQLIVKMTDRYYVEPVYPARLKTVLSWILTLQETDFGAFDDQDELTLSEIKQLLQEAGIDTSDLQMP